MLLYGSKMRNSILSCTTIVLILSAFFGTSSAAERPVLGSPAEAFVTFYGEAKSTDTGLGVTRLWRKGSFIVTHIDGKAEVGFDCLSFEKIADTPPLNRREAFLIAEMFCGNQEWEFRSDEDGQEFYVNADKTFQLAFSELASKSMRTHVTITCFHVTKGIEDL